MLYRRRFLTGLGSGAVAFIAAPAKAAQFVFKAATNFATDHPISIRAAQMFGAIQQQSNGRIEIQFFPNSQLGGDAAMFTQLRVGALQMFLISAGNLATVVPAADIANLGFAFADEEEAARVMSGPLGAYVRTEAAAKGIYAFRSIWEAGMFEIGSGSRPIRVPDDLHGFKLRVVESRIQIDLFKGLGATPTPLSFNEIYTSLQTKIIDGVAAPLVSFEASRFYEVQKYMSMTNHAWSGLWMIVNGEAWKSLPPDLQAVVERNNVKYAELEQRDTKTINVAARARLTAQGMTFNEVAQQPFRAAASRVLRYVGRMHSVLPNGACCRARCVANSKTRFSRSRGRGASRAPARAGRPFRRRRRR